MFKVDLSTGLPRHSRFYLGPIISDEQKAVLTDLSIDAYKSFTDEEKQALSYYYGAAYQVINKTLRNEIFNRRRLRGLPSEVESWIDAIDSAFAKAPRLPFDMFVYRHVSISKEDRKRFSSLEDFMNDEGFKSTSYDYDSPSSFIDFYTYDDYLVLKIRVPAGTRFLTKLEYSDEFDYHTPMDRDKESEILLPRCVKFKVTSKPIRIYVGIHNTPQMVDDPPRVAEGALVECEAVCPQDETPGDWRYKTL